MESGEALKLRVAKHMGPAAEPEISGPHHVTLN